MTAVHFGMALVRHIPVKFAHQTWPKVEPFFAAALEHAHSGYTLEQLRADLGVGRKMLVGVFEESQLIGALAITFMNRENVRVAFVSAIGGRGLVEPDAWEQLRELLKAEGATHIEGVGREAVSRLYHRIGFSKKYVVFGAEL